MPSGQQVFVTGCAGAVGQMQMHQLRTHPVRPRQRVDPGCARLQLSDCLHRAIQSNDRVCYPHPLDDQQARACTANTGIW